MQYFRLGNFVIGFLYVLTLISARQHRGCKICDDSVLCGTHNPQTFKCIHEFPCSLRQNWLCNQMVLPGSNTSICDIPGVFPHPKSSNLYYNCTINSVTRELEPRTQNCPLNTKFNPWAARCLTEEEAKAMNYVEKSSVFNRNDSSYQCKSPGTFEDENNCKIFYICNEKLKPQVFSCSRGRYFNGVRCKTTMTEKCVAQLNKISQDETTQYKQIYNRVKKFINETQNRNCSILLKSSQIIGITVLNSISSNLQSSDMKGGISIQKFVWNGPDLEKSFGNILKNNKTNYTDKIYINFDSGNYKKENKTNPAILPLASDDLKENLNSTEEGDLESSTGPQISDELLQTLSTDEQYQNNVTRDDEETSIEPENNITPSSVQDELKVTDFDSSQVSEKNSSETSGEDMKNDFQGIFPNITEPTTTPVEVSEDEYPKAEPIIFNHIFLTASPEDEYYIPTESYKTEVNEENGKETEGKGSVEYEENQQKDKKEEAKHYGENKENEVSKDYSENKEKEESKVSGENKENTTSIDKEENKVSKESSENKEKEESKVNGESKEYKVRKVYGGNKYKRESGKYEGTEKKRSDENNKTYATDSTIDLAKIVLTESTTVVSTTPKPTPTPPPRPRPPPPPPPPPPQPQPRPRPPPPPPPHFNCPDWGNFPYPNDCTKYYRCRWRHGNLVALPEYCRGGKYFYKYLGICLIRKPLRCS